MKHSSQNVLLIFAKRFINIMWGLSFITNINWCQTRRIGGVIGAATAPTPGVIGAAENGVGGPTTSEILLSADKLHDGWAVENNCQH